MRAEIKVSGIVQGVGFRPFIYRIAVKNGLLGYVRNRGDAIVEIIVEGNKPNIVQFLEDLKTKSNRLSSTVNKKRLLYRHITTSAATGKQ